MTTTLRSDTYTGFDEDINILATSHYRAPISRTIDLDFIQADANGSKFLKAGSIICNIPNSDFVRVLPVTKVAAAVAVNDTAVTVTDASVFKSGGTLTILRPFGTLTFGGNPIADNTVTLALQSQNLTYTILASDTTTTIAATSFAAFINAGVASDKVSAIAAGPIVNIYSKTGIAYTFTTSVTGTGISSTASNTVMQERAIGTINGINTTTNVITLAAGSAVALPIGAPIGVSVKSSDILGLTVQKVLVGSTQTLLDALTNDIAVYNYADIYTSLIPYWDAAIAAALPRISSIGRGN
jgi:hypothetical protein